MKTTRRQFLSASALAATTKGCGGQCGGREKLAASSFHTMISTLCRANGRVKAKTSPSCSKAKSLNQGSRRLPPFTSLRDSLMDILPVSILGGPQYSVCTQYLFCTTPYMDLI